MIMKKSILFVLFLLSFAYCFADGINMVGDPPDSHMGNDMGQDIAF